MSSTGEFGSIVVGTDGSDRAAIAVRHAIALAKMTGAELHVIHAIGLVHSAGVTGMIDAVQVQRVADDAKEAADRIRDDAIAAAEREGVSVTVHSSTGDPALAILDTAEAVNADLVVVGNRGMTGMTRFVLGSVPNAIAHRSPYSVLIVDTGTTE